MAGQSLLIVGDLQGFTPQIARLVCMMRYARHSLLEAVQGLTQADLDHLHDADSNSIGALLHHIAAIEWYYQVTTLEDRQPSGDEERQWLPAIALGDAGRRELRGRPLAFYTDLLGRVRERTLEGMRARDDAWLTTEQRWGDRTTNFHFLWFHVFEDELNHRGQIRWLRRRLPKVG